MFYIGVDIGTARDYTSVAILERTMRTREKQALPGTFEWEEEDQKIFYLYELRWLEEMPLGSSYVEIAERLKNITNNMGIRSRHRLILDATGVGRPVVDMLRREKVMVVPVQISGGYSTTQNDFGGYNVPKRDLVTALDVIFQTERIKIADLPLSAKFREQLKWFTAKTNSKGNQSYEAVTESVHDDIVTAVSLSVWYAEKIHQGQAEQKVFADKKSGDDYDPRLIGLE